MSTPPDDLEAVRIIAETLEPFDTATRERVIRWAMEKLGLTSAEAPPHKMSGKEGTPLPSQSHLTTHKKHAPNIKTFVAEKNPVSDTHFATTVAYYYRFEAPEAERKDSISSEDLKEACRQADRKRINYPRQTLNNAYKDGLLDKAGEKGRYKINTVGENLVAMTLPGGVVEKPIQRKRTLKNATKKATPKKANKQKPTKGK